MDKFISNLKATFRQGDIVTRLLYINVGLFLAVTVTHIVCALFKLPAGQWATWLELPASFTRFIGQPWSLVSYMFLHLHPMHLLFNMLWLYWFGRLFLGFFSARHLRGLYLLGGIGGGLLYMAAFHIFPLFADLAAVSYLLGASASVLAIVFAVGLSQPDYEIQLLLFGRVKLKYIAFAVFVIDLLFITSDNGGGHVAHIGGAMAGGWFARGMQKGYDVTDWINRLLDLFRWPKPSPRRPKMKVHVGGRSAGAATVARKKERTEEMDRILDKLRTSGYGSLSEDEKKSLFDGGKR